MTSQLSLPEAPVCLCCGFKPSLISAAVPTAAVYRLEGLAVPAGGARRAQVSTLCRTPAVGTCRLMQLVPDEMLMSPRFSLLQIQFTNRWKNISEHECGHPVTRRCCYIITKSLSCPEPFSCPWILLLHIRICSQPAFFCLWFRQHSPALAGAVYFFLFPNLLILLVLTFLLPRLGSTLYSSLSVSPICDFFHSFCLSISSCRCHCFYSHPLPRSSLIYPLTVLPFSVAAAFS